MRYQQGFQTAGKAIWIRQVYLSYYQNHRDPYTGQPYSIHYTDDGFGNLIVCDENKERAFQYSYTH